MNSIRFIMVLLSFLCFVAYAASYRSGDVIRLSEGDTLSSDLIAAGQVVEIQGILQGDAYSGCQEITVEGQISDDLIAAARTVSVKGFVNDMVVGFGEKVTIDGEVGGDVLAFGGEVRISERAHIKGNVYTGTGSFRLEGGRIDGWLRGGAGSLFLNGFVGKNVKLEAESVEFGPDYNAQAGTKLTLPEPLDKEKQDYIPDDIEVTIEEKSSFYQSGYFYWSLVSMFVTGLLIGIFFKQSIRNLLTNSQQNILKNSGIGIMVVFLAPLTIVLLIIPLITIPIALIIGALYAILLYLGLLFSSLYLGSYLLSLIQKGEALGSLILPYLIGLILMVLVTKIPYIGTLIKVALICLGSGSIITFLWSLKKGTMETA